MQNIGVGVIITALGIGYLLLFAYLIINGYLESVGQPPSGAMRLGEAASLWLCCAVAAIGFLGSMLVERH